MVNRTPANTLKVVWVLIWLLPLLGCATTYRGKVIDYETRQPIEGAAVVAYWYRARDTIMGTSTRLQEVKETLTDKNGEWSIQGERGSEAAIPIPIFCVAGYAYTRQPLFIVFKPGYCSWPKGFFLDACNGIAPGGHGEILEGRSVVELPRLTKREDRIRAKPAPEGERADWKKQQNFIELIREEWEFLYSEDPGNLYRIEENKNEK